MIKNIFLALAIIHSSTVLIVIWLMLFDLLDFGMGQHLAIVFIASIGIVSFGVYLDIKGSSK